MYQIIFWSSGIIYVTWKAEIKVLQKKKESFFLSKFKIKVRHFFWNSKNNFFLRTTHLLVWIIVVVQPNTNSLLMSNQTCPDPKMKHQMPTKLNPIKSNQIKYLLKLYKFYIKSTKYLHFTLIQKNIFQLPFLNMGFMLCGPRFDIWIKGFCFYGPIMRPKNMLNHAQWLRPYSLFNIFIF